MSFFETIAYAQTGTEGVAHGILGALFPIILLFLIFYLLLIRPQAKRAKAQREMWANLKKGDYVVTVGGLHGKITGLTDTVITLEIADKVRVKISRDKVMEVVKKSEQERAA